MAFSNTRIKNISQRNTDVRGKEFKYFGNSILSKLKILASIKKLFILGRKWEFGWELLSIAIRESVMKNCKLRGLKGIFNTKKMKPTGGILVEFQDDSVIWKIA